VLAAAGEVRTQAELGTDSWSTYAQLRRLIEATASALGGVGTLRDVGGTVLDASSSFDFLAVVQALGSPGALLANVGAAAQAFATVVDIDAEQVGPTEWVVRQRWKAGYEPFEAWCAFYAGVLTNVPPIFGLPPAWVVEEQCQCQGGGRCSFRARWEEADAAASQAEFISMQVRSLQARLEAIQRTVADVVSGHELREILPRLVASAASAVGAPCHVLVIDAVGGAEELICSSGLNRTQEREVVERLRAGTDGDDGCMIAEVRSNQRSYGRLAAIHREGGRFLPQERGLLDAYARLAAAALDSATALVEAHRQTATAHALLALSGSLAEVFSVEEVSARLARAVTDLVDCDFAVLALAEPDTETLRVVATYGCEDKVANQLSARRIALPGPDANHGPTRFDRRIDWPASALLDGVVPDMDSVGALSMPITSGDLRFGWIVSVATLRPERIRDNPRVGDCLHGLAGLAATALANTRLVDQIRHQATHDPLTGLPNRTMILERLDGLVTRARHGADAAVLFIDLDRFKDVNDTLGHEAGDQLLCAVAGRLALLVRASDTVGRLGGDEFIILVEAGPPDVDPEEIAERVLNALREPFQFEGDIRSPVTISASIGITCSLRSSPSRVLRDADAALYAAKATGRDRYSLAHAPRTRLRSPAS
jgi:diguanylate cyclase (GGDEF)-like protein